MPTINVTKGGSTELPYVSASQLVVLRNEVDFAKTPAAAADVVEVLNVPAGTLVLRAGYTITKADGSVAAGTLGDGADPDGYITAGNLNATAGTQVISPATTVGYATGKFYTAADTIDWTASDALSGAVVEFWAIAVKV